VSLFPFSFRLSMSNKKFLDHLPQAWFSIG
jgi:hypothetical protein